MKKAILAVLFLGVLAMSNYADENDGIFQIRIGTMDVYMIVESEREGNAGILVGADEATLRRYIPEGGFKHTANAFLLKTRTHNYLVDTGTGAGNIIIEKITKLGAPPESINAVFLTHLHGDHYGSLQKDGVATFPNATIFLSNNEHQYFTRTNRDERVIAALAPYGTRINTFIPGQLGRSLSAVVPEIYPIAAYGHTPGHTVYRIFSSNREFFIVGDLLHVAPVQFARPDISASYDMDQGAAAAVRRQFLQYAAMNHTPIGGMHIPYPGMGEVTAEGQGFIFTPR
jgi:glyoxylase-like metal-dependent hydrolase (beta-lactamase superfamily II)